MQAFYPWLFTSVARVVFRLFPSVLWRIPENTRKCYLTFDDGPTPHTPALLELLDAYQTPASFFLLGKQIQQYPHHARQVFRSGHTLGNHLYSHQDPWRLSSKELFKEAQLTQQLLEEITRTSTLPIRPPYGHITPSLLTWSQQQNIPVVLWDIMPGDFIPTLSPERMARFICKHLRPGSIIVLHDSVENASNTLALLEYLLPELRINGWTLAALEIC